MYSLVQHTPFFIPALPSMDWQLAKQVCILVAIPLVYRWYLSLTPPPPAATRRMATHSPWAPSAPRPRTKRSVSSRIQRQQPLRLLPSDEVNPVVCHAGVEELCKMFQSLNLSETRGALRPRGSKKTAKTVVWADDKNEVHLVENWIVKHIHIHQPFNGHVRWDHYDKVYEVDTWIVPDGHNQLHFPRTKWIRDVPDPAVEDLDGDIEMRDAG